MKSFISCYGNTIALGGKKAPFVGAITLNASTWRYNTNA